MTITIPTLSSAMHYTSIFLKRHPALSRIAAGAAMATVVILCLGVLAFLGLSVLHISEMLANFMEWSEATRDGIVTIIAAFVALTAVFSILVD